MAAELSFVEGNLGIGQASIHWRRAGQGPVILFLPGFPLSGSTWDAVIAALADRFTCYTFDLIGLGESRSPVDADHSSPGQGRAFQGTLSELGVTSYALVGNDTGGWIARELALVDLQRVTHLVLTNTEIPFHRPPWIPMYQQLAHLPGAGMFLQQLLKVRAYRRSSLGFGGCFYDLSHLDGEFHTRFVAPLMTSPERIDGAMRFLRNMKFMRLDEFSALHRQLAIPTLFIWGANDAIFPEAQARAMLPQFPQVAAFHSIANAKLFFYAEHPGEVAQLIARFVQ